MVLIGPAVRGLGLPKSPSCVKIEVKEAGLPGDGRLRIISRALVGAGILLVLAAVVAPLVQVRAFEGSEVLAPALVSLGDAWRALHPASLEGLRLALAGPGLRWLWDPVVVAILGVPLAGLALLAAGIAIGRANVRQGVPAQPPDQSIAPAGDPAGRQEQPKLAAAMARVRSIQNGQGHLKLISSTSPDNDGIQRPKITSDQKETFALATSRGFESWLARAGGSLAFTTYQAGKVFFLGLKPDGKQSVFERSFDRCMGIAVSADARTLFMATHYQLYRFDNLLPVGQRAADGSDAVFVPRLSCITGDLDIHDVAFGADNRPVFVSTAFGCLATVSDGASFKPLWKPPFLSKLAAEDRCHLNGMAMDNGAPRFVTAASVSDVADGWRDKRTGGGVIIDVMSNEIVCQGLSMPHSPRLHNGALWVLNSGTGEFGWVDVATRTFVPVAFCPGYVRGLTFAGGCAVIGLSLPRDNRTFQGLPLDAALDAKGTEARCGVIMVDLVTGDTVACVLLEGAVRELYDVAFLPGIRQPSAIGFKTDEITRLIAVDEG